MSVGMGRHAVPRGTPTPEDLAAIGPCHPSFTLGSHEQRATLDGVITLVSGAGVRRTVATRLVFPEHYPQGEPAAFDVGARFPHEADRHFFPNGRLCLWLMAESRWDASDPLRLARFLDEVAVFYDRQFVCELTGEFPGPQRGHGQAGLLEYVAETMGKPSDALPVLIHHIAQPTLTGRNDPCPCGSGTKYKRCHLPRVLVIHQRLGWAACRSLVATLSQVPA